MATDWQFLAEERSRALGPLMGDLTVAVLRNEELIAENKRLRFVLQWFIGYFDESLYQTGLCIGCGADKIVEPHETWCPVLEAQRVSAKED